MAVEDDNVLAEYFLIEMSEKGGASAQQAEVVKQIMATEGEPADVKQQFVTVGNDHVNAADAKQRFEMLRRDAGELSLQLYILLSSLRAMVINKSIQPMLQVSLLQEHKDLWKFHTRLQTRLQECKRDFPHYYYEATHLEDYLDVLRLHLMTVEMIKHIKPGYFVPLYVKLGSVCGIVSFVALLGWLIRK